MRVTRSRLKQTAARDQVILGYVVMCVIVWLCVIVCVCVCRPALDKLWWHISTVRTVKCKIVPIRNQNCTTKRRECKGSVVGCIEKYSTEKIGIVCGADEQIWGQSLGSLRILSASVAPCEREGMRIMPFIAHFIDEIMAGDGGWADSLSHLRKDKRNLIELGAFISSREEIVLWEVMVGDVVDTESIVSLLQCLVAPIGLLCLVCLSTFSLPNAWEILHDTATISEISGCVEVTKDP